MTLKTLGVNWRMYAHIASCIQCLDFAPCSSRYVFRELSDIFVTMPACLLLEALPCWLKEKMQLYI